MTVTQIVNPYAKPRCRTQDSAATATSQNGSNNNSIFLSTMGCQSQRREGAVKKALKKGTKAKYKAKKTKGLVQTAANGGLAFVPEQDCIICEVHAQKEHLSQLGIDISIPHQKHDVRCPRN